MRQGPTSHLTLAPCGAWLRQKSCHEISCSRSAGIEEVSFVWCSLRRRLCVKAGAGPFSFFYWITIGLLLVLFVCFSTWTQGESSGSTHRTRHLNSSPWQCYSLCWRMRHELKSSGDAKGGEGRGKATAWSLSFRSARWQSCERSARRGHAGRFRVVHRCIRSACRSRRCVGLCSVVVAVLAAAADAVLVALKVHPATIAGNPKARGKTCRRP